MNENDPGFRFLHRLKRPSLRLGTGLGLPPGGNGAPAAAFNFLGIETLDPRITFTRASTATRVNSLGVIETVSTGAARFDYDPVTLAPKGLLIESQRTNLALRSADITTTWVLSGAATLAANVAISPSGATDADTIAGSTAFVGIYQGVTIVSGATYTWSMFVKAISGATSIRTGSDGDAYLNFDLATGTISGARPGLSSSSAVACGNGWWRITGTYVATDTNDAIFAYTGSASATTFAVWGVQLEAGAYATSYIPTSGSQITRAGEVAVITGSAFSNFFNQNEGTWIVDFDMGGGSTAYPSNRILLALDDGVNDSYWLYNPSGEMRYYVRDGGTVQVNISLNILPADIRSKIGFTYKTDQYFATYDGMTGTTDGAGSVPNVDRMGLGVVASSGGGQLGGHIRRIDYYNRRLPNADIQRLTA